MLHATHRLHLSLAQGSVLMPLQLHCCFQLVRLAAVMLACPGILDSLMHLHN